MEKEQIKIRRGADTFANSAIILEKFTKAGINGDNFPNGHQEIMVQNFIPEIVLKAFSCELFLKSLIKNDNIKKIHKLDELFECLNKDDKDTIRESIIQFKSQKDSYTNDNFNSDLERVANAFVDWRYFYEKPRSINIEFLNVLFIILREYTHRK